MLLTWPANSLYSIILGAFSGGAPGWLYYDSNMSTLYQDAGTTPVTALEQPVGLQLDLSQGLVLGSEVITLAANRDFTSDTGYWSKAAGNAIGGGVCTFTSVALQSGISAVNLSQGSVYQVTYTITSVTSGGIQVYAGAKYSAPRTAIGTYTEIICANGNSIGGFVASAAGTTASITGVSFKRIAGNHRYQPTSANRPTWSARYNLLLATDSLSTQSVTTVATNYVLYFTGSGTVTLSGTSTGTLSAGSNTITCTAGTLTLTVSGSVLTADLRSADQAVGLLPQYQAVVTASNYDSVGFPAGLRWNGSNSWMQNASVDFSGTNKVANFVGARKQSDAALAVLTELSATIVSNNGTFLLSAPNSAAANLNFSSKGTTQVDDTVTTYTAPTTRVIAGIADIGAPSNIIMVNGVQVGSVLTTQGTGNFSNKPAFFSARNGASAFFNGMTYSNCAIGGGLSASQIAAFNAWTNSRARAY